MRVSSWFRRLLGGRDPFWVGVMSAFDISGRAAFPDLDKILGTPQDDLDALSEDWEIALGETVEEFEKRSGAVR